MTKKQVFILLVFYFSFSLILFGQTNKTDYFSELQRIGKNIPLSNGKNVQTEIKHFKRLVCSINNDSVVLRAIVYSKIGQELSNKKYYTEATYFYKKALQYRKKVGDYVPVRWALQSLYTNSLNAKNFRFAVKYSDVWMCLLMENLEDTSWHKVYYFIDQYDVAPSKVAYKDYIGRIMKVGNAEQSSWRNKLPNKEAEERYKKGEKMLITFFKNYKEGYPYLKLGLSVPLYEDIIEKYLIDGNLSKAYSWEKRALKILSKYCNKTEFTNQIRYIAKLYNDNYRRKGIKDSKVAAIRVMEKYAYECKKIERYDQVGFGLRYAGLCYLETNSYVKSMRCFADAIKICSQYEINNDISKSYMGVDKIIKKLKQEKDTLSIIKCQNWQKGYSLDCLPPIHSDSINKKLKILNAFTDLTKTYNGTNVSDGLIINGNREGKWVWRDIYNPEIITLIENYKNGLKEGELIYYYSTGNIGSRISYSNNLRNGISQNWYRSGKLMDSVFCKNDLEQGKAFHYSKDGNIETITEYKDGLKHGIKLSYYKNGKVHERINFQNGKHYGKYERFYSSGIKAQILNLENRSFEGTQTNFYENGELEKVIEFKNGKEHGECRYYDINGNVTKVEIWENGKLLDTKNF